MNNLEQQFLEGIFEPFNDSNPEDDDGKQSKGKKRGS